MDIGYGYLQPGQLTADERGLKALEEIGEGQLLLPEKGVDKLVTLTVLEKLEKLAEVEIGKSTTSHGADERYVFIYAGINKIRNHKEIAAQFAKTIAPKKKISEEENLGLSPSCSLAGKFLLLAKKEINSKEIECTRGEIERAIKHMHLLYGAKIVKKNEVEAFRKAVIEFCKKSADSNLKEMVHLQELKEIEKLPQSDEVGVIQALMEMIDIRFFLQAALQNVVHVLTIAEERGSKAMVSQTIELIFKVQLLRDFGLKKEYDGLFLACVSAIDPLRDMAVELIDVEECRLFNAFLFWLREQGYVMNTQLPLEPFIEVYAKTGETERRRGRIAVEKSYIEKNLPESELRTFLMENPGFSRRFANVVQNLWERCTLEIKPFPEDSLFTLTMEAIAGGKFKTRVLTIDLSNFKKDPVEPLDEVTKNALLGAIHASANLKEAIEKNRPYKGLEHLSHDELQELYELVFAFNWKLEEGLTQITRLPEIANDDPFGVDKSELDQKKKS